MTGGPGFQVAIGRLLTRVFARIEVWTAPVPQPILGLGLLALAAVFIVATLRDRRRPAPEEAHAADSAHHPHDTTTV